ncbi:hypothetical protein RRG08_031240 [Elysia crispata]|uniref:Uncharacterized protein n=1 Tax=Elysia crispata TaxID=231223 RepID=A0AAE1AIK7_9GAST|nr:hypothetical protein RRG08_031240 [Elysia crispata]
MGDISKAIHTLICDRTAGEDKITPEIIKIGKPLHKLLCLFSREGKVDQDMPDAKIITLYKTKRGRSDCNNYKGISLLSIVGKDFTRVVLVRLQVLAERIYQSRSVASQPRGRWWS